MKLTVSRDTLSFLVVLFVIVLIIVKKCSEGQEEYYDEDVFNSDQKAMDSAA